MPLLQSLMVKQFELVPMEDIVEMRDSHFRGLAHQRETNRKSGGKWHIAMLHLTRTRVIVTPKTAA